MSSLQQNFSAVFNAPQHPQWAARTLLGTASGHKHCEEILNEF